MRIIKGHPALLVLPVLSAIFTTIVGWLFALPLIARATDFATERTIVVTEVDRISIVNGAVYFFVASLVLMFIKQFFEAAIVHGSYCRLVGQAPTVGASLYWIGTKIVVLAPWVLTHTIVSSFARKARNGGVVSRLLGGGLAMSWKMATFIVLPILVVEELGAKQAYQRSRELMSGRYGLSATATFGLAAAGWVAAGVSGVMMSFGVQMGGPGYALAAFGLFVLACTSTVLTTLTGVYRSALYYYAVSGQEPPGFESTDLAHAFA